MIKIIKLSKQLNTVTPFSKYLALFLFILFPIIGFYLGIKYQEKTRIIDTPTVIQDTKEVYPECIIGSCPTFTSVWSPDLGDITVISISTAMTQGAGQIVIMSQGEKIFDSGELPGIGFEMLDEGNGFILKYSSAYDENFNRKDYEVRYIWEDGQFVEK